MLHNFEMPKQKTRVNRRDTCKLQLIYDRSERWNKNLA